MYLCHPLCNVCVFIGLFCVYIGRVCVFMGLFCGTPPTFMTPMYSTIFVTHTNQSWKTRVIGSLTHTHTRTRTHAFALPLSPPLLHTTHINKHSSQASNRPRMRLSHFFRLRSGQRVVILQFLVRYRLLLIARAPVLHIVAPSPH